MPAPQRLLDHVIDGLAPEGGLLDKCLALVLLTGCWVALAGAGLALLGS